MGFAKYSLNNQDTSLMVSDGVCSNACAQTHFLLISWRTEVDCTRDVSSAVPAEVGIT